MGLEKGPLNQRARTDRAWDWAGYAIMGLEKGPLNQRLEARRFSEETTGGHGS